MVEVLSDVSNSKFGLVTVNILAGKSTESTRGSIVIGEVNFSIFQFEFFFFFFFFKKFHHRTPSESTARLLKHFFLVPSSEENKPRV